jgi:hypothetical protein
MNTSPVVRIGAAVALVLGPVTLIATGVAQWFVQPAGEAPTPVDVAGQFPELWLVLGLASVLGPVVWLGGVPATVTLAPARGSATTRIGAIVTGAGLAAGVGHLAIFFSVYAALAASGLEPASMPGALAAADAEPLGTVLLIMFLVGFSLGPIVLTVGLRMAKRVPVWVPIAAVVTAAANLVGGPVAAIVQYLALLLVWIPVAVALVRSSSARAGLASVAPEAAVAV